MAKTEYTDEIKFTHEGQEITFKTAPNPLSNTQMWWFEPLVSVYAGTVKDAKKIAKNIRDKNKLK